MKIVKTQPEAIYNIECTQTELNQIFALVGFINGCSSRTANKEANLRYKLNLPDNADIIDSLYDTLKGYYK